MPDTISENQVKTMYKDYEKGLSLSQVGTKWSINSHTLSKYFKKYNLKVRSNKDFRTFSDSDIQNICDWYNQGFSTIKIAEHFKCHSNKIHKYLKRNGIRLRSNRDNSRVYTFDKFYFNKIDTEDKAYWLGFIYADGYITSPIKHSSRRLGISISTIDINHLQKFKDCIKTDYPIHIYKTSSGYSKNIEYCRIQVSSEDICNDLNKYGVFEHKTNIIKPPNINTNLIRDFIRGYIDGDGSIYKTENEYGYDYHVNIIGTNDLLEFIHNYFYQNNLTNKNLYLEKRKSYHTVSNIRYGGNQQTYKILNHVYSDANIYLDRKYNLYQELNTLLSKRNK